MWFYKHIQTVSPPVNELYMCEGEVPHLSVELPLPLAVDAHLGHLDDVTNLQEDDWNIFQASSDQLSLYVMHPIISSWLRINIFFTNHSSTDLQSESSFVVSIGNSTLFDSSVGWQGSLGKTSVSIWKSVVEETMDAYLYI